MEITRTFDLLEKIRHDYPGTSDVLACKEKGTWIKYSIDDYIGYADHISFGLLAMGLKKGDKVATISNNRPEWNFMDMGLSQAGMVHVPIYPTISEEEYAYILNHCEPSVLVVSDKNLYDKISPIAGKVASIKQVFSYNEIDGVKNWKEIVELGKNNRATWKDALNKIKASIHPDEMVTLIYTSGTTGNSKGVMLSHNNIVSNVYATIDAHDLGFGSKTLSFLPLSHIYERLMNYHFQFKGIAVYYAENMGTIVDNLKEIRPQIFNTVPRLLERVYDRIMGKGRELSGIKKMIFFWAVNLGLRYERNRANGWFYYFKLSIADKLVFKKWREALGGRTQYIVSGGAALQPRLARVFGAAGLQVLEGYGLTETSPVIAVNRPQTNEVKFGTVGPVVPNVSVKIADDGEILCKGPNIMLGYYKAPGLTQEVIDGDGWLHTGDIGVIEDGKYLRITDRKKEIFKLSSGKYIAPQVIENKLKESSFIEQVMVIGENQKFASALISPDFQFLHNWASLHNVNYRDNAELISNEQVVARFQREVNEINRQLGVTDQIKRFRLVQEEWTPVTGELSPTLKLKRKFLTQKYATLINEIFSVQKSLDAEE